jgi:tripartite-type tricarboxylate transporter receptor subunit TctC
MIARRCRLLLIVSMLQAFAHLGPAAALAEDFPMHAVRIIVPFPPGGSADLIARIVADRLSKQWPHPVVVENRVGGNRSLAALAIIQAPPDGHMILWGTGPVFTTNPLLFKNLQYDPVRDFKMVSLAAVTPNVLGVYPKLPFATVPELMAYARANPGKLSFASSGMASSGHLGGTLMMQLGNIDMRHIPYRGAAPAWNDVIAGHVSMMWDGIPAILGQIEAGSIRPLAVGSRERWPGLPDVPTAIESGLPGFVSESWFAAAVSINTPDPLVRQISTAMAGILHSPEVAARIKSMGARPVGSTPEEATAYARDVTELWRKVIEKAHISVE